MLSISVSLNLSTWYSVTGKWDYLNKYVMFNFKWEKNTTSGVCSTTIHNYDASTWKILLVSKRSNMLLKLDEVIPGSFTDTQTEAIVDQRRFDRNPKTWSLSLQLLGCVAIYEWRAWRIISYLRPRLCRRVRWWSLNGWCLSTGTRQPRGRGASAVVCGAGRTTG